MTPAQQRRAQALFDELFSLSAAERAAILAATDGAEVVAEVESLLQHTEGATLGISAVIEELLGQGATDGLAVGAIRDGVRFGHYRIERRIGHGGMGDVYEAFRDDDFHKRVALKVVRYDLDSEFANRRFEQERQLLAGLEHPNIARLLDGGGSESGRPYLVLEYVEGLAIDQYCEGKPRDMVLQLFLKVCAAVEYAHRNLVIHRDLKPANILVTADGEPKLLDFGIAKLLDAGADVTQTGLSALTPQYASPEQVRGGTITTASDVYSLGLILYELLTRRKPYSVSSASALEVDRIVCQVEPSRPGVSEDLDNILLMALRKDPARRYTSVREFADDIDRSLINRPVTARPDTLGYRTRKFVRRHWAGVAAGFAVFVAVTGGVAATVYQARVARQRFDQVRQLAHSFVFDYSDELARLDGTTNLRERMVRTALEYLDSLSRNVGNDLSFQKELAAAYQKVGDAQGYPTRPSLGHTDQAIASYRKAAALHERIAAREPSHRRERGAFYIDFAGLLRLTGNYEEAAQIGEAARLDLEESVRRQPADESARRNLSHVWCLLGDLEEDQFHITQALTKIRRCDELARLVLDSSRTYDNLMLVQQAEERLGTAATATARFDEALAAFDEDQRLLDEMVKIQPNNPALHRLYALLAEFRASVFYDQGEPNLNDPRRCLVYARQYEHIVRQTVEKDPGNTSAQRSLATALYRESIPLRVLDPRAAVAKAQESVRLFDNLVASGTRSYLVLSRRARAQGRLSEALLTIGRPEQAQLYAEQALAGQRVAADHDRRDPQESLLLALALADSARAYDAIGRRDDAFRFLKEADQVSAAALTPSHNELDLIIPRSTVLEEIAKTWKEAGNEAESQRRLAEARELWRDFPDQSDYVRRESARLARPLPERPINKIEIATRSSPPVVSPR